MTVIRKFIFPGNLTRIEKGRVCKPAPFSILSDIVSSGSQASDGRPFVSSLAFQVPLATFGTNSSRPAGLSNDKSSSGLTVA